jgi:4-hydroxyproline epimerase
MFEPRGHDVMSGSILYPPTREDCDVAILFIETSGCLPMCGHGTIGTVTMAIEHGLIKPKTPGTLRLDTPAGLVDCRVQAGRRLCRGSAHHQRAVLPLCRRADGRMRGTRRDQSSTSPMAAISTRSSSRRRITATWPTTRPAILIAWSPVVRQRLNEKYQFRASGKSRHRPAVAHAVDGAPKHAEAHARNAVFYGDKAIDRSPCGTGTSARMAQLARQGQAQGG